MDQRNLRFITADRTFFEPPDRVSPSRGTRLILPPALDWTTWSTRTTNSWQYVGSGGELPMQGWKIHVSATQDTAQNVLFAAAAYCWTRRIDFKFVPTMAALLESNGKQAHRGTAGKFITIYTSTLDDLHETLDGLDAVIGGQPGPYILSDLRWKDGPLYVRYGGFAHMLVNDDNDEPVPAILDPAGSLVPDIRGPVFSVPDWVEIPGFLQEQRDLLRLSSDSDREFPYAVDEARHFSNGGGVYAAARHVDGARRILKEARPNAGLTADGRDAVARSHAEADALRRLEDLPNVVALHETLSVEGHHFLALEEIEGPTVQHALVQRTPLVKADSRPEDYLVYRDWALGLIDQLESTVAAVHNRGLVIGDVHPNNILVTSDDRAVLIDFEMAQPIEHATTVVIGAPGFTPPPDLVGRAGDLWSLAVVELFLFIPLTPLLSLDAQKLDDLIDYAESTFSLPPDLVSRIRSRLQVAAPTAGGLGRERDLAVAAWDTGTEDGLFQLQVALGRGIEASADFSRPDRAYPGDPQQYRENGFGLAHGAAGVIHALTSARLDVSPHAAVWLRSATRAESASTQLGLYEGLAGVAWLNRRFGDSAESDRVLGIIEAEVGSRLAHPERTLGSDLYSGLAGIGLFLLSEGTPAADALSSRLAAELERRLEAGSLFNSAAKRPRNGLIRGPSGVALFATRLYERTSDKRHLQLATRALQLDLDRCATAADGSLHIDEGWRLMPYLDAGSAGVGLAIAQLLPHVAEPDQYLNALDGIQTALQAPFTIESSVFSGRAGFIHSLVYLSRAGLATARSEDALDRHVEALRLHALRYNTGILFPGTGLLRMSADFATGAAGVLSALQAYELLRHEPERPGWSDLLPLLVSETSPRLVGDKPNTTRGGGEIHR